MVSEIPKGEVFSEVLLTQLVFDFLGQKQHRNHISTTVFNQIWLPALPAILKTEETKGRRFMR